MDDPASGVTLIPTAALTAADGAPAAAAVGRPRPRRFRAADGVHFTGEGYLYLGAYVLAEIERALPVQLAAPKRRTVPFCRSAANCRLAGAPAILGLPTLDGR